MKVLNIITTVVAILALGVAVTLAVVVDHVTVSDNHKFTQLYNKNRALTAQNRALTARTNGVHRDLITCSDFGVLLRAMNNFGDSNGDTAFWGNSSQVNYPTHCINQ